MQQEDDLRGLAKIMDFLRAISILFIIINIYWYCYEAVRECGFNVGVIDKILINFQNRMGIFDSIVYTKLFALLMLALSCMGTIGVKEQTITWIKIWTLMGAGFVLLFLNWWILALPFPLVANTALYIFTMAIGYICLLMSGLYMSRLLKSNLMDDVFNRSEERRVGKEC